MSCRAVPCVVTPTIILSAVRATHLLIFRTQVACLNGTVRPSAAVIDRIGRDWHNVPSLATAL